MKWILCSVVVLVALVALAEWLADVDGVKSV